MIVSTIAKRYALALFRLAKEHQLLDQIEEELKIVKEVIEEHTELKIVLQSPNLSIAEKKAIVNDAFASMHLFVRNTISLLLDRHRENYLSGVAEQFISLVNEEKGIAVAKVYTVKPLTEAEKAAFSAVFAAKVGKSSLLIENIIDSNILGGVKLRIGNRIFDGSLSGKLKRLERKLLS
ncbi:F0F1 ATP synthase subunit delta [Bacillaceae bacterium Marseille-Q3522]|nr:F0F1 ATP synthase subunit delta [Bacillaceae bacterium Marseille-Q3522]